LREREKKKRRREEGEGKEKREIAKPPALPCLPSLVAP
jgi:hypothetical protein